MASILKVDKIRGTGLDSDSISIDGSGNLTTTKTLSAPGHVIQVVQNTDGTSSTTTSTSYVNTPLSVTITPTSATSKIHLNFNFAAGFMQQNYHGYMTIYRDSTNLNPASAGGDNDGFFLHGNSGPDGPYLYICRYYNFSYLDSPNTTSAVTYYLAMKMANSAATFYYNINRNGDNNAGGAGIAIATEIAQ